MTRETQFKLLGEFYAEKKNVMKLKGEDYANEDVLSNFKSAGANCGISAELQCLSLIATKVARLGNLLSGKTPNNESVADSILDLSNYTDLLYCIVNEQITDVVNSEQKKHLVEIMNADEKDGLYNIKPNNLLDEKYKQFQPLTPEECTEPINETYEPKVGDRFENIFRRIWEIVSVQKLYCILERSEDCDVVRVEYSHKQLQAEIKEGILKKIN